jgi:hypothetical protein
MDHNADSAFLADDLPEEKYMADDARLSDSGRSHQYEGQNVWLYEDEEKVFTGHSIFRDGRLLPTGHLRLWDSPFLLHEIPWDLLDRLNDDFLQFLQEFMASRIAQLGEAIQEKARFGVTETEWQREIRVLTKDLMARARHITDWQGNRLRTLMRNKHAKMMAKKKEKKDGVERVKVPKPPVPPKQGFLCKELGIQFDDFGVMTWIDLPSEFYDQGENRRARWTTKVWRKEHVGIMPA